MSGGRTCKRRRAVAALLALLVLVASAGVVPLPWPARGAGSGAAAGAAEAAGGESEFVPLSPTRVYDSREHSPRPAQTFDLPLAATLGSPPVGAAAVALSVTMVGDGYVTVWPAGAARPATSNVNGVSRAPGGGLAATNLVIVGLGPSGAISVFRHDATSEVIVDVVGWFPTGSSLHPVAPARLVDTRNHGALGPRGEMTVPARGLAGVPADARAVVLNVTGVLPGAPTFLTAWPTGTARPLASNVNLDPGDVKPNLVVVPVGADGTVSIYSNDGPVDVVVDVFAWLPVGAPIVPLAPARLADSRDGTGIGAVRIGGCGFVDVAVLGRGGVPAAGVGAVALNVTAVAPDTGTYLTAWPAGGRAPLASNVTAALAATNATAVIAPVGADGRVSILNYLGSTDLVVDVLAWFPEATSPGTPPEPAQASSCRRSAGRSLLEDASADGRWVAFRSDARNLSAGDQDEADDVFVKDRANGAVRRVDTPGGTGALPVAARVSDDGRRLLVSAYRQISTDTGLATQDAGLWLVELSTGAAQRVPTPGVALDVALSGDGTTVAYTWQVPEAADATAVVWNASNGSSATVGPALALGGVTNLALSADGRYLAYPVRTAATVLAATAQIWDRSTNQTRPVPGLVGHGGVPKVSLSGDGQLLGVHEPGTASQRVYELGGGTAKTAPLVSGHRSALGTVSGAGGRAVYLDLGTGAASAPMALATWDPRTGASQGQRALPRSGGASLANPVVADDGTVLFGWFGPKLTPDATGPSSVYASRSDGTIELVSIPR